MTQRKRLRGEHRAGISGKAESVVRSIGAPHPAIVADTGLRTEEKVFCQPKAGSPILHHVAAALEVVLGAQGDVEITGSAKEAQTLALLAVKGEASDIASGVQLEKVVRNCGAGKKRKFVFAVVETQARSAQPGAARTGELVDPVFSRLPRQALAKVDQTERKSWGAIHNAAGSEVYRVAANLAVIFKLTRGIETMISNLLRPTQRIEKGVVGRAPGARELEVAAEASVGQLRFASQQAGRNELDRVFDYMNDDANRSPIHIRQCHGLAT